MRHSEKKVSETEAAIRKEFFEDPLFEFLYSIIPSPRERLKEYKQFGD